MKARTSIAPTHSTSRPHLAKMFAALTILVAPVYAFAQGRPAATTIAPLAPRDADQPVTRPSGFRKRSTDLFRVQRKLQIGHQDVQLRLRLRAKSRNAISVELRF